MRHRFVRVLLALVLALVVAPAAHAQVAPVASEVDVKAIAQFDSEVERVLSYRPGSVLVTKFDPLQGEWTVHVREPGSTRDLARVTINDRTRAVVDRWFLPFGKYPPRLRERQAERIARRDPDTIAAAKEFGGVGKLYVDADYVDGSTWEVDFVRGKKTVIRVDVRDATGSVKGVFTGHQIAWKMARGTPGAFGGDINLWYVWWPLFAVFALVMLDPLRLWSWSNLDVVALLSFGVSHAFFDRGMIEWSVPLAVPPLVYLLVRMSLLFVRGVTPGATPESTRRLALWPPTWLLVALALFAGGVRYGVNVTGTSVIDVGYAGVAGATQIVNGRTPYGNMPEDNRNGDTYGPANYLAYVPAVLIFDDAEDGDWGSGLPAAHAVSIASDLLCVLALVVVGWRWMSRRAAALLACGWLTYPFTAFALASNVNDLLVAALLLLAFAALPRAWLRAGLVAIAASVKFVPIVALAPLAHAGVRGRVRQVAVGAAAVVAVALASWAFIASYPHGVDRFVRATWDFQYDRSSPFSPWGLYGWRTAQQLTQAVIGAALLAAIVFPRVRDFRQVAAGCAAAMLAVQIVLQHWFYLYIPWFAGFVLLVLVAQRASVAAPLRAARDSYTGAHGTAAEHSSGRIDPRG